MRKKIVVGDCFRANDARMRIVYELTPIGQIYEATDQWEPLMGISEMIPTLHLPISEPWFGRILSGEKREEYRLKRGFYGQRLCENWDSWIFAENNDLKFKPFKVIHLTNGYGAHRPQLWAHIEEITIGKGKPEWGAPEHDVFIIRLGEVFHTKNLKK